MITTRTSDASGPQSAAFGPYSGSAQFVLGFAIAWKNGSNATNIEAACGVSGTFERTCWIIAVAVSLLLLGDLGLHILRSRPPVRA